MSRRSTRSSSLPRLLRSKPVRIAVIAVAVYASVCGLMLGLTFGLVWAARWL